MKNTQSFSNKNDCVKFYKKGFESAALNSTFLKKTIKMY